MCMSPGLALTCHLYSMTTYRCLFYLTFPAPWGGDSMILYFLSKSLYFYELQANPLSVSRVILLKMRCRKITWHLFSGDAPSRHLQRFDVLFFKPFSHYPFVCCGLPHPIGHMTPLWLCASPRECLCSQGLILLCARSDIKKHTSKPTARFPHPPALFPVIS